VELGGAIKLHAAFREECACRKSGEGKPYLAILSDHSDCETALVGNGTGNHATTACLAFFLMHKESILGGVPVSYDF
jgi:hypothetical protein